MSTLIHVVSGTFTDLGSMFLMSICSEILFGRFYDCLILISPSWGLWEGKW